MGQEGPEILVCQVLLIRFKGHSGIISMVQLLAKALCILCVCM